MAELPFPITYRPSGIKILLVFAGGLVLAAGGLLMASEKPLVGYVCTIFFGVSALIYVVNLHPRAAYLEITKEGFTTCSLFRRVFTPWADVSEFLPIRIQFNSMVGWNYSSKSNRLVGFRRIKTALAGAENALPDTYGMSAEQLATILNAMLFRNRQ